MKGAERSERGPLVVIASKKRGSGCGGLGWCLHDVDHGHRQAAMKAEAPAPFNAPRKMLGNRVLGSSVFILLLQAVSMGALEGVQHHTPCQYRISQSKQSISKSFVDCWADRAPSHLGNSLAVRLRGGVGAGEEQTGELGWDLEEEDDGNESNTSGVDGDGNCRLHIKLVDMKTEREEDVYLGIAANSTVEQLRSEVSSTTTPHHAWY